MSLQRALASIDTIYDAGAGGASWAAVGSSLAKLVKARSASLMLREPGAARFKVLGHPNIPDEAVADYLANFRQHDLWTQRAAAQVGRPGGVPRIWSSGSLVPEAEFLRSEFWNRFGRHHGLRYVIGTVVPLGRPATCRWGCNGRPGRSPLRARTSGCWRRCCRICAARCNCATGSPPSPAPPRR